MIREKSKLAFVDLDFHKKSHSGDFLREVFAEKYDVVDFWYDWFDKDTISLALVDKLKDFDCIFFFQVLLKYDHIYFLRQKNIKIIWAPMYDGLPLNWGFWIGIKSLGIKIFSFSSSINKKVEEYNIDHIKLKYFKEPLSSSNENKQIIKIFFWYRGNLKFEDWIKVINPNDIKEIVYLSIPDPAFQEEKISNKLIDKFNIKIIKKDFLISEDFLRFVDECDIFVCPRKQEGIGMSMLEAIARGKFLIGFNDNTMNDYIIHTKNGLLFNENSKDRLTIDIYNNSILNCKKSAEIGFNDWLNNINNVQNAFQSFNNDSIKISSIKYYLISHIYLFSKYYFSIKMTLILITKRFSKRF